MLISEEIEVNQSSSTANFLQTTSTTSHYVGLRNVCLWILFLPLCDCTKQYMGIQNFTEGLVTMEMGGYFLW